jgi:periplasmic nitrate reductase NapE
MSTSPFDPGSTPHAPRTGPVVDRQRKTEEFRTWLFLALVLAPLLAIMVVAGYGFLVWIFQMIAGPPTYGG